MTDRQPNQQSTNTSLLARYWMMGAIAAVVLVGAIGAGIFAANLTTGNGTANNDAIPELEIGGERQYYGVRINPPWPKPELVLTDTDGNAFNIVEETEGYVTLVALGYTNCPDYCPMHMHDIATTLRAMDPEDAAQVKVVFITTDPDRDSPEVIRRWLDLFNPNFIGLTGTQDEVDRAQIALGVEPAQRQESDRVGPGGYEVNHALWVYAFERETNLARLVYPIGVEQDEWLNDITLLVREGYDGS
jgi:protein SCO1